MRLERRDDFYASRLPEAAPSGYRDVRTAAEDERFAPLAFPEAGVALRDLLG